MLEGTVEGHLNVQRLFDTVDRVLNENNPGAKFTSTSIRKKDAPRKESKKELQTAV